MILAEGTHISNSKLSTHVDEIHPDEKCQVCGRKFYTANPAIHFIRKHAKKNEKGEYQCPLCNEPHKYKPSLREHVRVDHYQEEPFRKSYQCPHCEKLWSMKYTMDQHIKRVHPTGNEIFVCHECNAEFLSSCKLHAHKQIHHTKVFKVCDTCGKSFKLTTALNQHIKTQHKKEDPLFCQTCGKKWYSNASLRDHQKTHETGVYPCTVDGCQKVFDNKIKFQTHVRKNHCEKKPLKHECDICSKRFRIKSLLKNHVDFVHLKIRNFKCDQCDTACPTKGKLEVHKKSIHERILIHCDFPGCTKSFNYRGNLNAHKYKIHKIPRSNTESSDKS